MNRRLSRHAVAYGECGHSYGGCTCSEFIYDPDLTSQKDDDAYEAAVDLREGIIRDRRLGIIYGRKNNDDE